MYHSFLIHSSADGHLGCFYVLAIINSAAMNIGVHVSLSILVSLVCMPRSGIAGSYGGFIPSFEGIPILFSIVAVSVYIPTNNARGFPFLHTLSSAFIVCRFFLMMAILTSHCSFVCISLIMDNVEMKTHLFMCLLAIWISSLDKSF